MQIELDHLFLCTAPGAPEAEKLVQFGLHEGPPNQHPDQGTACRRSNASQKIIESGVLATRTGATSLLEIEFDGHRRKERVDFRPHLPVIFPL
jgi:hypothetical protein